MVQRGVDWTPRLLLAVPNVTAHPSTASVPITVLLYSRQLLCGFNVRVKGLKAATHFRVFLYFFTKDIGRNVLPGYSFIWDFSKKLTIFNPRRLSGALSNSNIHSFVCSFVCRLGRECHQRCHSFHHEKLLSPVRDIYTSGGGLPVALASITAPNREYSAPVDLCERWFRCQRLVEPAAWLVLSLQRLRHHSTPTQTRNDITMYVHASCAPVRNSFRLIVSIH